MEDSRLKRGFKFKWRSQEGGLAPAARNLNEVSVDTKAGASPFLTAQFNLESAFRQTDFGHWILGIGLQGGS